MTHGQWEAVRPPVLQIVRVPLPERQVVGKFHPVPLRLQVVAPKGPNMGLPALRVQIVRVTLNICLSGERFGITYLNRNPAQCPSALTCTARPNT